MPVLSPTKRVKAAHRVNGLAPLTTFKGRSEFWIILPGLQGDAPLLDLLQFVASALDGELCICPPLPPEIRQYVREFQSDVLEREVTLEPRRQIGIPGHT